MTVIPTNWIQKSKTYRREESKLKTKSPMWTMSKITERGLIKNNETNTFTKRLSNMANTYIMQQALRHSSRMKMSKKMKKKIKKNMNKSTKNPRQMKRHKSRAEKTKVLEDTAGFLTEGQADRDDKIKEMKKICDAKKSRTHLKDVSNLFKILMDEAIRMGDEEVTEDQKKLNVAMKVTGEVVNLVDESMMAMADELGMTVAELEAELASGDEDATADADEFADTEFGDMFGVMDMMMSLNPNKSSEEEEEAGAEEAGEEKVEAQEAGAEKVEGEEAETKKPEDD